MSAVTESQLQQLSYSCWVKLRGEVPDDVLVAANEAMMRANQEGDGDGGSVAAGVRVLLDLGPDAVAARVAEVLAAGRAAVEEARRSANALLEHQQEQERVRVAGLHAYYQQRQAVFIARLAAVRDLARVDRKTVRTVDLRAALAVKAETSDQEG